MKIDELRDCKHAPIFSSIEALFVYLVSIFLPKYSIIYMYVVRVLSSGGEGWGGAAV